MLLSSRSLKNSRYLLGSRRQICNSVPYPHTVASGRPTPGMYSARMTPGSQPCRTPPRVDCPSQAFPSGLSVASYLASTSGLSRQTVQQPFTSGTISALTRVVRPVGVSHVHSRDGATSTGTVAVRSTDSAVCFSQLSDKPTTRGQPNNGIVV